MLSNSCISPINRRFCRDPKRAPLICGAPDSKAYKPFAPIKHFVASLSMAPALTGAVPGTISAATYVWCTYRSGR